MALRPIAPGLRVMVNPSHDVAKVSLVIPAGASIVVPDDVADQLERQGLKAVVAVTPEAEQAPALDDAPKAKKAKG